MKRMIKLAAPSQDLDAKKQKQDYDRYRKLVKAHSRISKVRVGLSSPEK